MLQGFDMVKASGNRLTRSNIENLFGLTVQSDGGEWFSAKDLTENSLFLSPASGVFAEDPLSGHDGTALYFFKEIEDAVSRRNVGLNYDHGELTKNINLSMFISMDTLSQDTPFLQLTGNNGYISFWISKEGELIMSSTRVFFNSLQSIATPSLIRKFTDTDFVLNTGSGFHIEIRLILSVTNINIAVNVNGHSIVDPVNIPNVSGTTLVSAAAVVIPANYYFEDQNNVTVIFDDLSFIFSDNSFDISMKGNQSINYVPANYSGFPNDWFNRNGSQKLDGYVDVILSDNPYIAEDGGNGTELIRKFPDVERIMPDFTHYQLLLRAEISDDEDLTAQLTVGDTVVQTEVYTDTDRNVVIYSAIVDDFGDLPLNLTTLGNSKLSLIKGVVI